MGQSDYTASFGTECGRPAERAPAGRIDRSAGLVARRLAGPICLLAGLAVAWVYGSHGLAAQRTSRVLQPAAGGQTGQFWTSTTTLEDGRQMLLLLDQHSRCLAIYHVDPAAGTVQLKSTRDLTWDFTIEEFNAQEPKPSSLKKMAEMPK